MSNHILLRISDKGEISLFDERDKFQASFRGGQWVATRIFQTYELEEFRIVEDEEEIARISEQARSLLDCPLTTL